VDSAPEQSAEPLHGEELAEITNGIVGLFSKYYGRGPTRAKSYVLDDDYLVTVLRDTLTSVDARSPSTVTPTRYAAYD
jgi:uncharacterized protein YbcI